MEASTPGPDGGVGCEDGDRSVRVSNRDTESTDHQKDTRPVTH